MIHLFLLLFLFTLSSCSEKDDDLFMNMEMKTTEVSNTNQKTIGYFKDGEIVIDISSEEILRWYENFNIENNLKRTPSHFKLVNDSRDYHLLRFYNTEEIVSTFRLYKMKDSEIVVVLGTTCETTACAHTSGCEPRILFSGCTKCSGDCKKTTSNGLPKLFKNLDPI